jgi:hypothetical protein
MKALRPLMVLSFMTACAGSISEPDVPGAPLSSTAEPLSGCYPVGTTLDVTKAGYLRQTPGYTTILANVHAGAHVALLQGCSTTAQSVVWYNVEYGTQKGWMGQDHLKVVSVADAGSSSPDAGSSTPDAGFTGGAYWGARVCNPNGSMPPWNMSYQATFESTVAGGKGASLMHWGAPFTSPDGTYNYAFDTSAASNVLTHGAISVYDWAPYRDGQGMNQPAYSLGSVISGTWDSYLTNWFQAVKAWGHPLFLRWAWEMNIQAWPWSEGVNGNTTGQYVQAWHHVHDLALSVGATNISWVWCPNTSPSTNYAEFYPGDAYVDWTCIDGYNWGTDPAGHMLGWQTFGQVFDSAYQAILTIAPSKPIMIGETASTEYGGSKSAWISDMLGTRLPNDYPKIRGFMWFECDYNNMDWSLESSPSPEQAFSQGIQSSYFAPNQFGSANTSPIAPP